MDTPKPIKVKRRIIRRSQDANWNQKDNKIPSDDDTSSICSDTSGASFGRKKKLKRIRRSCPIHGKQHMIKKYGDKAYAMPEFDKFKENSQNFERTVTPDTKGVNFLPSLAEEPELHCTCDNSKKRHSRQRPEPEGGHLTLDCMDEFEKIIYTREPLFSDMGEDDSEIENQIRFEANRYHRRSSKSDMNIFASALSFNSNTLMKFAIIQTELKNIVEVHLKRVSILHIIYNFGF